MQTVKVALNEANRDQLFYYAATVLGLDVKHNTGETKLLAKITEANPDLKEIEVPDETPAADNEATVNEPAASEAAPAPIVAAAAAPVVAPVVTQAPDTTPAPAPAAQGDPMNAMVEILIERTEGRDGERPVFVSVNGVGQLIPRGEPVKVKMKYVKVLENAVAERFSQDEKGDMKSYKAMQYPFRIISGPAA